MLRKIAWLLLCASLLALALAPAHAGSFDWRSRGVLFRIEARPAAAAETGVEIAAGAGAEAEVKTEAMNGGAEAAGAMPPAVEAPSYLFATIHYGSAAELGLDLHGLRERLQQTRVLVNEVNGAEQWREEYEPYRRLARGQSLRKLLGEADFSLLQAQLPGSDAEVLDGLKPWVAMSMLEMPVESGHDSIDVQLEDWARESGLRLVHLENLPEQLAALDCVPAQEYALVLGQRLRSGWSFEQEVTRTKGYYKRRDLPAWMDEIERMPGLDASAMPIEQRARHCLIETRNARWLPLLQRLLRQERCFVAVGAIHLTGEQGLLAQLNRHGFTVSVEPW